MKTGYSGVKKRITTNIEFRKKNTKASVNEKMFSKIGFSFGYVNFIKDSTSPNSVILYPEKTDLFPENQKTEFRHDMYNKLWALRFVHPRKIIMPSELGKTKESGSITHIEIVNGKGYEKLNYDPGNKPNFGIFPLKK